MPRGHYVSVNGEPDPVAPRATNELGRTTGLERLSIAALQSLEQSREEPDDTGPTVSRRAVLQLIVDDLDDELAELRARITLLLAAKDACATVLQILDDDSQEPDA